jgi:O-antigen/teichoic acid export membrane protein
MVIGLWMVPLTLGYIDPTKYGIWLTLTSLITWLNFFDVGLGYGLRNKLAEALAKKEHDKARGYVSTTYAILSLIMLLVFVVFLLVNRFIDWSVILNAPVSINEDINRLVFIVFSFFCVRFVLGLILSVLNADQRLSTSGFIDLLVNAASLGSVYLVSILIPDSLVSLGAAMSLVHAVILLIANFWFLQRDYKDIRPSFRAVNFTLAKDLSQLSFQFFVLQIVALMMLFSSNIVIAQLLGPASVSEFNVVYKYFSVITTAVILILNPFWTAATDAYVKEDFEWLRRSSQRLTRIWFLIFIATVVMVAVSPYVYQLWLKGKIEPSFRTSIFMGIYVVVFSWSNSFIYLINGIGKIRLQLYINIVMGLLVIPMSYFFIRVMGMGIDGCILSMTVCLIPPSILIPWQFHKIINRTATGVFYR